MRIREDSHIQKSLKLGLEVDTPNHPFPTQPAWATFILCVYYSTPSALQCKENTTDIQARPAGKLAEK